MKIIGIGIDILKIKRLKRIIKIYKDKFIKKILSKKEIKKYKKKKRKINFLAKSFVIKEATCKALGTGMKKGISFKSIEIYKNKLNKPKINYLSKALKKKRKLGVKKSHISFTDEKKYAQAIVILE
ncbi:MAG: holo-ACP synthase [Buchnera aphidicola (Periphyllus lyropictus)]|uniref:holo-ACP synthase n=1 Tax=Buchnera aphidicola TaxID=9 RepID=UPI001EC800D6|nr:holo-ACP synthase [Buchnera aphidicola]NIH16621.1 holo-ACP synthase [Buchnera aphidicola (Periphyllus lyropictus)]USS94533.1 holo-ACP synthase [Buchnera aphidicola (Periphyllus lyropictus)]